MIPILTKTIKKYKEYQDSNQQNLNQQEEDIKQNILKTNESDVKLNDCIYQDLNQQNLDQLEEEANKQNILKTNESDVKLHDCKCDICDICIGKNVEYQELIKNGEYYEGYIKFKNFSYSKDLDLVKQEFAERSEFKNATITYKPGSIIVFFQFLGNAVQESIQDLSLKFIGQVALELTPVVLYHTPQVAQYITQAFPYVAAGLTIGAGFGVLAYQIQIRIEAYRQCALGNHSWRLINQGYFHCGKQIKFFCKGSYGLMNYGNAWICQNDGCNNLHCERCNVE